MPRSLRHFNLAFIHKSVGLANSASAHAKNNERLEYLGDAILEAVVSDILYHRFPNEQEGYLSKLRSNMVCRARLNAISLELGLDKYIVMTSRKDLVISHIPGDALEAFVAAIYLDGGLRKARKFALRHVANDRRIAEALGEMKQDNYKSQLVNLGEQSGVEVFFETHRSTDEEKNPDVNFVTEVKLADVVVGRGAGRSKKLAEQMAARMVLEGIRLGEIEMKDKRASDDSASEAAPQSQSASAGQPLPFPPANTAAKCLHFNLYPSTPNPTETAAHICLPSLPLSEDIFAPLASEVNPLCEADAPDGLVPSLHCADSSDSEDDMLRSLGATS